MLPDFIGMIINVLYFALRIGGGNSFPKPLNAEEEQKHLELCAQGNIESRNILIERNLRLVAHIIKKYYAASKEQDDLISIGTIGLIKAINSYRSDKGTRLATYAARCIENEILMYFRSLKRCAGEVSLSDPIENDNDGNNIVLLDIISVDDTMDEDLDERDNIKRLIGFMDDYLDTREREIVLMRYGINRQKPVAQCEIAKKFGISRSYVSRIEKRAICKLKRAFEEHNIS